MFYFTQRGSEKFQEELSQILGKEVTCTFVDARYKRHPIVQWAMSVGATVRIEDASS